MRNCSRCGVALESGFAAVILDGTATPLFWVAGSLEQEFLTGGAKVRDRERDRIVALRCSACFNVEWQTGLPQD